MIIRRQHPGGSGTIVQAWPLNGYALLNKELRLHGDLRDAERNSVNKLLNIRKKLNLRIFANKVMRLVIIYLN